MAPRHRRQRCVRSSMGPSYLFCAGPLTARRHRVISGRTSHAAPQTMAHQINPLVRIGPAANNIHDVVGRSGGSRRSRSSRNAMDHKTSPWVAMLRRDLRTASSTQMTFPWAHLEVVTGVVVGLLRIVTHLAHKPRSPESADKCVPRGWDHATPAWGAPVWRDDRPRTGMEARRGLRPAAKFAVTVNKTPARRGP